MATFLAACVQMTSGDDIAANIAQAAPLVAQAAKAGATLIALPENAFYLRREGTANIPDVPMARHEGLRWAREAAREHGAWLLAGSIRAREEGMEKAANRSVLVAPDGGIAAFYDKLHLFDVTTPDGKTYHESSQALHGGEPVVARTSLATLGLTICYDVRFPGLYRALALAGAEVFTVPSAFTRPTGKAHWHTLLRARAIENAAYVLAPAQCGTHPGGRETYGHSLIVDPWGTVLAEGSAEETGVVTAEIDIAKVVQIRAQLPVLAHHRDLPTVRVFA